MLWKKHPYIKTLVWLCILKVYTKLEESDSSTLTFKKGKNRKGGKERKDK